MTIGKTRANELVSLLKDAVEDPLSAALAVAAKEPDAETRHAIVEAAATAPGQRITTRSVQLLTRYARQAAKAPEIATALADRLAAVQTTAAQWLAAALLEALAQHDRAATILSGIDDASWGEERAIRLLALARNRIKAGQLDQAWLPLRHAAVAAETRQSAVAVTTLLNEARRTAKPPARATRRIAVIGTGTLQFWSDVLKSALFGAGIDAEIFIGGFNQYQQEVVDPESPLAAFRPEIVIIAAGTRALGLPDVSPDPDAAVSDTIEQFRQLWTTCQQRFGAAVIQLNFETPEIDPFGRLSTAVRGGRARIVQRLNLELWNAAEKQNIAVLDLNEAAASYGKQRWNDPGMWIAARQYPAADAVPFLAKNIAALVRAACGLTSKCLVLDLDGTLWGGIIGEDGLTGIRLGGDPEGEAYTDFHRYILGLRRRGIPLAVCSKNNEADALSVFRQHPETLIKEEDFAVFLANWEPKPDNLRRIASMLNIGIDSLVFLDDNPVERAFIRTELPEVEVPELPENPALYAEALHRTYLFEALNFTEDDARRADNYRENAQRAEFAAATANMDEYLSSLRMKVELRPFDEINLPRIAQLINKTNQFNLTTRRTTAAEVAQWMQDPNCYTQFMRLHDRFGDSGITGILIAFREGSTVRIDNWLMSCRVLGRRIENAMIASAIAWAQASGARVLRGDYLPTAKNDQVSSIYERYGFQPVQRSDDGAVSYQLALDNAVLPSTEWFEVDDTTAAAAAHAV